MFRRSISLMLCICMVLSMLPMRTPAETVEEPTVPVETTAAPTEQTTVPSAPEETEAPTEPEETEEESVPTEESTVPEESAPSTVPTEQLPAEPEEPDDRNGDWDASSEWMDKEIFDWDALMASGFCGAGENGVPGENLTWELYRNGLLVIKGSGAMMDYTEGRLHVDAEEQFPTDPDGFVSHSTAPWDEYVLHGDNVDYFRYHVEHVELPEGLTHIGDYAFYHGSLNNDLSVALPGTLRSIGEYSFYGCGIKENIVLPDTLEEIGSNAFRYNYFTEIEIPEGITTIPDAAFYGCWDLEKVTLPDTLTEIGKQAFMLCYPLETIALPESLIKIDSSAFNKCGLTSITIPAAVQEVGHYAFENCPALGEVVLSNGETIFQRTAFSGSPVKNVVFLEGCHKIPENFFYQWRDLETLEIPGHITEIGDAAFLNCYGLKEIVIPNTVEKIGENVFAGCESLEKVVLPDHLTVLPEYLFLNCASLKTVELPAGITDLSTAFVECTGLESLVVPAGVTETFTFSGCTSLKDIQFLGTLTKVWDYAFGNCTSLEEMVFPDAVEYFGAGVFEGCTSLRRVVLPENMTYLDQDVFKDCVSLMSVELPNTIAEIGYRAFQNCRSLTDIILPEKLEYIYHDAFNSCTSLCTVSRSGDMVIPGVMTLSGWLFLDDFAFANCDSLRKINAADARLNIHYEFAFTECDNLEEVNLGWHSWIGYGTFENCRNLRRIYFRDPDCWGFNSRALNGCDQLSDVYVRVSQEKWESSLPFFGEKNDPLYKATIHYDGVLETGSCGGSAGSQNGVSYEWLMSDTLRITGSGAMKNYASAEDVPWYSYRNKIRKIEIQDGITHIGSHAFEGMRSLEEMTVTKSLKSVGAYAFKNSVLQRVRYDDTLASWKKITVGSGNEALMNAEIEAIPIEDHFTNASIVVNGMGNAYANYLTSPGTLMYYEIDGIAHSGEGDANGILQIDLGKYIYQKEGINEYTIPIRFTQYDRIVLDTPITMTARVRVAPLQFTKSWELSFDKSVTAGKFEGFKIGVGPAELKAGVGVSVTGKTGRSINIEREFSNNSETLELTSDLRGGFGVKAGGEVGLDLDPHDVAPKESKIVLGEVSGSLRVQTTGTYGLRAEHYSPTNTQQQRAIGAFLLGELLMSQSQNNQLIRELYQYLIADNVYRASGCDVIYGEAVETAGEINFDIAKVEVNGKDVFGDVPGAGGAMGGSLLSGVGGFVYTSGHKEYFSGDKGEPSNLYEVEGELVTDRAVNLFKGSLKGFAFGGDDSGSKDDGSVTPEFEGDLITRKEESPEIEISYKNNRGEEALSLKMLDYEYSEPKTYYKDKTVTSQYKNFILKKAALEELSYYDDYVDRSKNHADILTMVDAGCVVLGRKNPVEFERSEKQETVHALSFGLSVAAGIELGAKLEAAYKEDMDVVTESGVMTQEGIFTTSKSDELPGLISGAQFGFWEIFTNAIASLAKDAVNAFDRAVNKFTEDVKTRWLEIRGNPDADTNLVVDVTAAKSEGEEAVSYAVSTRNQLDAQMIRDGIREAESTTTLRRTIGRAALISVYDTVPENVVDDFRDTPLTCIIRYEEADLEAAGLSKLSPVVQERQIAMYRYIDEADYFEYIGGEHDPDAMTVTAQITKPGQYVLAVDSCAPQLSSLELSSHNSNPTISAYVDDLSGLDMSKFKFALDGTTLVDSENVADHYDAKTGKFTYEVTGDGLSHGEHTMSFTLADTTATGNIATYEYTFTVDLTVPVIVEESVTGSANENSAVEIRAQISDDNLAEVAAVFSRLQSDGQWSEEVAVEMVQLEDGLWGLDYKGDGSSVKVYIRATDIGGNRATSKIYEVKPYVKQINIPEEYLALRAGQTHTVHAEVSPAEFAGKIQWSTDNADIITVDDKGIVTAKAVGTAYVIATVTDGNLTLTDRCRVDVAEALVLEGIQLADAKATSELYSTDYAELEMLMKLPREAAFMSGTEDTQIPETKAAAIQSAAFRNEDAARFFDLIPLDDRRLAIVPTDYAVKNPTLVKSSYKSIVLVTVEGKEYESNPLTLTVKKSTPKLKVTIPAFNSFYSGQSQTIAVTGGTPTAIYADGAKTTAIPNWLTLENGTLKLNKNAPKKGTSGKAYILVDTEEWRIPAAVTLSVKNTYKAPGLKLSASTVTMTAVAENSDGIALKLVPADKKNTLSALNVANITAPEGYAVEGFNLQDGSFLLRSTGAVKAGKITLTVSFRDTAVELPLNLTVKTSDVKLKLSRSTVTLNKKVSESVEVLAAATPADFRVNLQDYRLTDAKGKDKKESGELKVRLDGGKITVSTTDTTPADGSYKLYVSAGGSKEVALTVRIIENVPTVTYKVTGALDLSFPEKAAAITPSFKNYSGSFRFPETETAQFVLKQEGSTVSVQCKDMAEPGNYTVPLKLILSDGSPAEGSVKLTVKRTPVKLKLTATKLSLNKMVNDKGSIGVSCTTKGYDFVEPVVQPEDSAVGKLDIRYENGRLNVATKEETEYGKTYKITLKANASAPASTLTVTIPTEAKSAITPSLKASGKIDVIRRDSAVTITPSYKNCVSPTVQEELLIYDSSKTCVNHLFAITSNGAGGYTVRKAENAALAAGAYKVKLVVMCGGEPVSSKEIGMTVAMAAPKMTVRTADTTLFAEDKNDRARIWVETKDAALNEISGIEIKDTKYQDKFEVFSYGNGEFAIGFRNGIVHEDLIGKSVTLNLNVFIRGNQTDKANTTVKVKLTVIQ